MPLQATSGAASYDAFGGGVPVVPNYIEDVFSTWLFNGTSATQTITNGIDLSTKGGLVWIKNRNGTYFNTLFDTVRGTSKALYSNTTDAETGTSGVTAFNTTGFTLGAGANTNAAGFTFASWTFRKQPKFFDVVTYTGNGANRTILHNLGSTPGCIIIKRTDSADNWIVYHRSLGNDYELFLDLTYAKNYTNDFNFTSPTSTTFAVNGNPAVNASGGTYVAYLFAHDAGGFGLTGTDNVISCGSFTTDGSGVASVTLGYEPQFLLQKPTSTTGNWFIADNMRGMPVGANATLLRPNLSDAESAGGVMSPTATGFSVSGFQGSQTYIYIAIRRGPMKVPTSGTSVYNAVSRTGTSANATVTGASFAPDITVIAGQSNSSGKTWVDKLRGPNKALLSAYTNAEQTTTDWVTGFTNTGFTLGADTSGADYVNKSPKTYINWMFGRAPSFFDEVCYTGTGNNPLVLNHNLGVPPELIIIKKRVAIGSATNWYCGANFTSSTYTEILLNADGGGAVYNYPNWFVSAPTATTFDLNGGGNVNSSGAATVAYLFATCAGVSKVGSFTGNGSSQTINCGFTGGARFVMIKATSTTGDWMVADSARGIVSGSDPYLELNNTNAEVTGEDWLDTDSTGFVVNEVSGSNANTNGVTYIFLAIA